MTHAWRRTFLEHPSAVGESYGEHFAAATGFGLQLLAAGAACLLHALVPAWCTRSASRRVADLARELEARSRSGGYAVAGTTARASSASGSASLHSRSRS